MRYFKRRPFRANDLLFRLLKAFKQEVQFQRLANRTRFASTRQLVRFIVQRTASQIPHHQILQAISHQDFPSRIPQLYDDVFFFNLRSKLILHMYDVRGLDVIGPDVRSSGHFMTRITTYCSTTTGSRWQTPLLRSQIPCAANHKKPSQMAGFLLYNRLTIYELAFVINSTISSEMPVVLKPPSCMRFCMVT